MSLRDGSFWLILATFGATACGPKAEPPRPYIEVGPKKQVNFDAVDGGHTVNAMVGQVNGQPIYADEIFREIELNGADLSRLGAGSTRQQFAAKAEELIRGTLQRRIENELVRAEAERELTDQHRRQIDHMIKENREKILALYGKGSRREADAAIRKEKGHGLDRELEMLREHLLIRGHIMNKIGFKIHVTQRDVQRYYQANPDEFGASPTVVRVILAEDAATADQIDKALADGADFEQVGRTHSILYPEKGGLLVKHNGRFSKFDATGWDTVNQAIRKLKPRQHTPRLRTESGHWAWARLERVGGGRKKLEEVYLEIEEELRQRQIKQLQDAYRVELLDRRPDVSFDRMIRQLIAVALTRYSSGEFEPARDAEAGSGS